MDEFRRKPVNRLTQPSVASPQAQSQAAPLIHPLISAQVEPITPQPLIPEAQISNPKPKKSRKKLIIWSITGLLAAIILTIGGILLWYTIQLSPVDSTNTDKKIVKVELGSTPDEIAKLLKDEGLIRSPTAFLWHARFQGVQNNLQAGTYRLAPSESTPEITEHIKSGKVDTFSIRFLPGATLADNKKVLIAAGYSEQDINAALEKTYDSPLFEGKPAGADLEGYIYGETYAFATNTSVETILQRTFDEFYSVVKDNNLVVLYKAQGHTLYEGITLASIVQREASSDGEDMPQIAQVFYSRLAIEMPLGSDVTYQYIADKTGVTRDPNLDSPYNTRRYTGLPPGPIASPGKKALLAVGKPATGDYLYFLSGDDNITYFSHDLDGHEANIANHCQIKCKIL
ncbi:MAG: endolytic transglycosylase MltG [Candidatus Saccharimonadaceae bacterium]